MASVAISALSTEHPALAALTIHRYRFVLEVQPGPPVVMFEHKGSALRGTLLRRLHARFCPQPAVCGAASPLRCHCHSQCGLAMLLNPPTSAADPQAGRGDDLPHPYTIVPELSGRTLYRPGERFEFGITLFGRAHRALPYVMGAVDAFADNLGRSGADGLRGRLKLIEVWAEQPIARERELLWGAGQKLRWVDFGITIHDLAKANARAVGLRFLTPTTLKAQGKELCAAPPFAVLMQRLWERAVGLMRLQGEELRLPFAEMSAAAAQVELAPASSDAAHWVDLDRYSASHGEKHSIGGIVGRARYSGDLTPFLPWLTFGQWLHVGKNTVQGNGIYVVESANPLGKGAIMELIVEDYGVLVTKHSERVQVKKDGKLVQEVPLIHLEGIILASSGLTISADLIELCAKQGIPLSFITRRGEPIARLASPELAGGGTASTRREQLLAFADGRGVALAKAFADGKLHNQAALLKHMAKYRRQSDADACRIVDAAVAAIEDMGSRLAMLQVANVDELRPQLLNLEGRAAQHYWRGVGCLLREGVDWPGRERRGADDPLNMALNYGYAILYSQVEYALVRAGLDPYAGFIHTDRAGKTSLVYDAIEEFRPVVVDRAVFALFNLGHKLKVDEEGLFDQPSRKLIAQKVFARLDSAEVYGGKKHKLREIIQLQARRIATAVRGIGEYKPFMFRW